jgi:hypothetical protein
MLRQIKCCLLSLAFVVISSACVSNGVLDNNNDVKNNNPELIIEDIEEDVSENDTEVNMGLKRNEYNFERKPGKNIPTKEFFETVDRDATREFVLEEIGTPNASAGSGISYSIWDLEDGYSAWVHFSYKDQKIETITIQDSEGKGEMIYSR